MTATAIKHLGGIRQIVYECVVYIKKEKELAQRTGSRKVAALTTSARIRVAIFTVVEEPGTLCIESRKSREAKHG